MIHKFRDMPADLNTRSNIYVLIDEAHRTTGGDLGNFLMAGLPNASFLGFTGTPVDKTVYGKGRRNTGSPVAWSSARPTGGPRGTDPGEVGWRRGP
jgi:type I site-specific restriction-modification system R (restriction) subunit